jgi:hypothetical protein
MDFRGTQWHRPPARESNRCSLREQASCLTSVGSRRRPCDHPTAAETQDGRQRITERMCVLRVSGEHFDPVKFLGSSTLEPYSVFHAGEPRFASQSSGEIHAVSGFKVHVSRQSRDALPGQVADAIAFLVKHERTLLELRELEEVEDIRLDFPVNLQIDRQNVFTQYEYFPPKLIALAGAVGCGLEISIYPRDLLQLAKSRQKLPRHRSGSRRTGRR